MESHISWFVCIYVYFKLNSHMQNTIKKIEGSHVLNLNGIIVWGLFLFKIWIDIRTFGCWGILKYCYRDLFFSFHFPLSTRAYSLGSRPTKRKVRVAYSNWQRGRISWAIDDTREKKTVWTTCLANAGIGSGPHWLTCRPLKMPNPLLDLTSSMWDNLVLVRWVWWERPNYINTLIFYFSTPSGLAYFLYFIFLTFSSLIRYFSY